MIEIMDTAMTALDADFLARVRRDRGVPWQELRHDLKLVHGLSDDDFDRLFERLKSARLIGAGMFLTVLTPLGVAALEDYESQIVPAARRRRVGRPVRP